MKNLIKLGIISLIVLGIFVMGLSLLIPSTTRVSRAMDINAPVDSVLSRVGDLSNWSNWNLLLKDEQWNQMTVSPTAIQSVSWNIQLIEKGSEKVMTDWSNPSGQLVHSGIELHSTGNGYTVVQWYFEFNVNWYPWEKFASILFDRQVGPVMEKSLDQLKNQLEN